MNIHDYAPLELNVLVDEHAADDIADLLERFAHWLDGPDMTAAQNCTYALTSGHSRDPEDIASHADALAEHLRDQTENTQNQ